MGRISFSSSDFQNASSSSNESSESPAEEREDPDESENCRLYLSDRIEKQIVSKGVNCCLVIRAVYYSETEPRDNNRRRRVYIVKVD